MIDFGRSQDSGRRFAEIPEEMKAKAIKLMGSMFEWSIRLEVFVWSSGKIQEVSNRLLENRPTTIILVVSDPSQWSYSVSRAGRGAPCQPSGDPGRHRR